MAVSVTSLDVLTGALVRLEEVVDYETAALRRREKVDLKALNDRKNHALLELSRAMRHMNGSGGAPLAERLAGLRRKLEVNAQVLKMHLEAVREVSSTLAEVIRDADSDGTYSPSIRNAYGRP